MMGPFEDSQQPGEFDNISFMDYFILNDKRLLFLILLLLKCYYFILNDKQAASPILKTFILCNNFQIRLK